MTFGREIYFSTVHSTVYIGKTIFLRKCTVTDKYQKPVPVFELVTATIRLNAHPSSSVPQAYM